MFERFTDRARKVMALANQEAQRFSHEYIGTEHILLGLVKEGSGVGANVLKNLEVDLRKVRLEVEKLVKSGTEMVTMELPQTPRAKKVIEYAIHEARDLNHGYVGTSHLLLGILREQDGVAAQVLMNLGIKLEEVRDRVLNRKMGMESYPAAPLSIVSGELPVAVDGPKKKFCPMCSKEGKKSRITCGNISVMCMGSLPYYDDEGEYHDHDPNTHSAYFYCSNDHKWVECSTQPCPNPKCDYGESEPKVRSIG